MAGSVASLVCGLQNRRVRPRGAVRNEPAFGDPGDVSDGSCGEGAKAVAMGIGMKVQALCLGILLSSATLTLSADEPISMKVSPAVAFAPANLVVRTTIPSDAANRAVEISAESVDFYRSSEIQLEGEHAARTTRFEFRSLPPGRYEVRAILYGANGTRGVARQEIHVMASGAGERN
jgi:hypothetical protein